MIEYPNTISPEEHRAIARFPEHRVQFIPPGVSAFGPGEFIGKMVNRRNLPANVRARHSRIRGRYRALIEAGHSLAEIADEMNVVVETARRALRKMDLIPRVTFGNPARDEMIRQLCANHTYAEIVERTGITKGGLSKACRRLGVRPVLVAERRGAVEP